VKKIHWQLWKKILLIAMGSEENKPQINADERRFMASNPAHLIGS